MTVDAADLLPDVERLRKMLVGVTWERFAKVLNAYEIVPLSSCYKINNIIFYARYGLHLQRPCLAVIARGMFVTFTYVKQDGYLVALVADPITSLIHHPGCGLYSGDFYPSSSALVTLDGRILRQTDFILDGNGSNES